MTYHQDERKESKYGGLSFTTKQVENTAGFATVAGSKKMSQKYLQANKSQVDFAQPKNDKRKSSTNRNNELKCSSSNQYKYNEIRDSTDFERYLIRQKEQDMEEKAKKYDAHSSMNKIKASKEGLDGLVNNHDANKLLENVAEASPHFNISSINVKIETEEYDTSSSRFVYEQNPITGNILRSRVHFVNDLFHGKTSNQDEKMAVYNSLLNLLSRFADAVFMCTSGVLAGYSVYTLHYISSLPLVDLTMLQDRYAGIARFYLMSITLCSTGAIVKGNISIRDKGRTLIMPVLLICCHITALMFTLTIAKLELLNSQNESVMDSNLDFNQAKVWKNLTIVRSVLCIIQWLLVCFWKTTTKMCKLQF